MFAATTSPSYSPTWVSGQMPVTSPIAQSRSPARMYSSTRIPWGLASTPTVSRPIPATRGGGVHPEHQLDSIPAQGLAERLAQRRGLARNHPVGALDKRHLAAET